MNNQDTRFANQYNIQWFPGHMTKTLRMMEQEIQHVDASLVLLDARIPLSSLNPEIERITARKPKLYVLNKADLNNIVTMEMVSKFYDKLLARQSLSSWFCVILGSVILSAGFVLFMNPYRVVPGGVYGTGIVLHALVPSVQV
jgi:hypothetical protein